MTQIPIIKCDCMDTKSKYIIQNCLETAINNIQDEMDMARDMMTPREMREKPEILRRYKDRIEERKQIMRTLDTIRSCPE